MGRNREEQRAKGKVQSGRSKVQSAKCKVVGADGKVQCVFGENAESAEWETL